MSFLDADNDLLKIDAGYGLVAIICLTSNGISENISEFIETSDLGTKGEQSFIPRMYGYSISFSGIAGVETDLMSWEDLKALKRDKTRLTWQNITIADSEEGQGYISSLEKISSAGDYVQFSGTITGIGAIVSEFNYLATSDADLFDTGVGKLLVA